MESVVLVGMESVGKSALFRQLTGHDAGDEANVRGSTVTCRHAKLRGASCDCDLIDTPGIRVSSDSATTAAALEEAGRASTLVLVARATHVSEELSELLSRLPLEERPAALVLTFEDKFKDASRATEHFCKTLRIPVAAVNARRLHENGRRQILDAIASATPLQAPAEKSRRIQGWDTIQPERTAFEHPRFGAWLAALACLALFALPVYAAYRLSGWLQSGADAIVLQPIRAWVDAWPALAKNFLIGDYGLISLGGYSFIWAFPVVLFLGVGISLAEETGLKDRITAALDPCLRRIGLSGRDLIPVLSGFGCNVVAVFQSRSCSGCTRAGCVSMISFASACSYQIGASLSLFGAAGKPWLFLPYLTALFAVGALHTRLWNGALPKQDAVTLSDRAFLQAPSWRSLAWKVKTAIRQFLFQAMPIFILLCAISTLFQYLGFLELFSKAIGPLVQIFGLPETVAPALTLSILRKDGLLVLNQGAGATLASLTAPQIFLAVYLSSTFTACLVTLYTVSKELGPKFSLMNAGRQMITSLVSAFALSLIFKLHF